MLFVNPVNDFKLNCTFENGSCDWDMGNDEKKSFIVGKGKTPTENTGPYHDHTFKNNSGKESSIPLSVNKIITRVFINLNLWKST